MKPGQFLVLVIILMCASTTLASASDTSGTVVKNDTNPVTNIADGTVQEFQYDNDVKPLGFRGGRPRGLAVLFKNKNSTIILKGVRIFGCRYGDLDGVVNVSVYDSNLHELYRDSIPYRDLKFDEVKTAKTVGCDYGSWVDIPLADHVVTIDFYTGIFLDSYSPSEDKHSIYIGYATPSDTHTSFYLTYPRMQIETDPTITGTGIAVSNINWFIRARYIQAPHTIPNNIPNTTTLTSAETPALIATTTLKTPSPEVTIMENKEPAKPSNALVQATPVPTKAALGITMLVIGVILGIMTMRRIR